MARNQTLLKPELFQPALELMLIESNRTIQEIIDEEYPTDEFLQEIIELIRTGTRKSNKISLSECEVIDNRLFFRGRLMIPENDELKVKILRETHDAPAAGHPGRARTLELIQRNYHWPQMHETVRRFVSCCHICSRAKSSRLKYQGLLKPLPVPDRRWQDISVDFIVDLPSSQGCKNIMVVVCRLSKMFHAIACDDMTAPAVAKMFLREVWKHHGLPRTIVSDRGRQFVSAFWKEATQQLGAKALLSTAFHPETDGQTERVNAVLEQYLRAYVSYLQDDWYDWLPMCEFAGNNAVSATTGVSPFFANSGQHPRMGYEPPTGQIRPVYQRSQALDANAFVEKMSEIEGFLKEEMQWAQAVYENTANINRSPAPAYQVGDEVLLDARNITTTRPTQKLDWKNLGPFKVIKVVSPYSYRLELPNTMKIHDVFHTSRLRPAAGIEEAIPGQKQLPPPPIIVDGEEEYLIERIDDMRFNKRRRRFEYLVRWSGYDEPTWEPVENIEETHAVDSFHNRYPDKERPPSLELAGARP
jgi:hypothetical protein